MYYLFIHQVFIKHIIYAVLILETEDIVMSRTKTLHTELSVGLGKWAVKQIIATTLIRILIMNVKVALDHKESSHIV